MESQEPLMLALWRRWSDYATTQLDVSYAFHMLPS